MNLLPAILVAFLMQGLPVGALNGIAIDIVTGEAVEKATLELNTLDTSDNSVGEPYTVAAGENGRFSFRAIEPGRYRLSASRPGYVRTEYAQRKANGGGVPIEIGPGQTVADLKIAMTPTGAIFGRVYDATGRPVVKADVQVLSTAYEGGRRVLKVAQSAVTNDLGEYRFFWLTPAQYYVGAGMPAPGSGIFLVLNSEGPVGNGIFGGGYGSPPADPLAPTRMPPDGTAQAVRYQRVYFPNTIDDQAAEAIDVRAGSNLGGIDIRVSPVRTRRVRGVVIDGETGQPAKIQSPQPAQIITSPATTGTSSPFVNATTGAFDTQVLQVPTVVTATLGLKAGRVSIPYGDTDLDDVRIILTSGYSLPGQIHLDGPAADSASKLTGLRVSLRAEPRTLFTVSPLQNSGVPSSSGAFTVQSVIAGDYRVNVAPILSLNDPAPAVPAVFEKWYVKSITYGDADALNDVLHIGGPPDRPLAIVLGTDSGSITGTALNDRQELQPDITVVLLPVNTNRTDLVRSVATDAMGKFAIDRIPPGDYKAFAWDDIVSGAWNDLQFMRLYEDRGIFLRIAPAGNQEIQLAVIPPRR